MIQCIGSNSKSSVGGDKIVKIDKTINVIYKSMYFFRIGNHFELLFSQKELCDVFYTPKIFKDMKFVTYSANVFKTFTSDHKAIVARRWELDEIILKNKILYIAFLLRMLFLAFWHGHLKQCGLQAIYHVIIQKTLIKWNHNYLSCWISFRLIFDPATFIYPSNLYSNLERLNDINS